MSRSPGGESKLSDVIPDAAYLSTKYDVYLEGEGDDRNDSEDQASMASRLSEIAQNQEFAARTERLVAALDEKNRELEKMSILIETIQPIPGMDPEKYLHLVSGDEDAPDFRDAKIVSLAKKCRNLTDNLRRERTELDKVKRAKVDLEQKCVALEEKVSGAVAESSRAQARREASSSSGSGGGGSGDSDSSSINPQKLKKEAQVASKQVED